MNKFLSILLPICVIFFAGFAKADNSPPPSKTWTFLIYLNGNNSLDEFSTRNILDMEKVGSNDKVNIVVEWGSLRARKAVRMLITKSNKPGKITSPILENLGLVDMGKVESLKDFIAWGVSNFPADHYFIDVWNHGSGWRMANKSSFQTFDISWDDRFNHAISTEELGQAMSYAAKLIGHKVDLYGSDACLMAMVEVANEMSQSVNYYLGSQETEPGAGWPYSSFLTQWESLPDASPVAISQLLVDNYIKYYQKHNTGDNVTFAAYDMQKLASLNTAIATLAAKLQQLNPQERAKVREIARQTQRFAYQDYADLMDFVKGLRAEKISSLTQDDFQALENAAHELVIANGFTKGYSKVSGISIWLPTYLKDYTPYLDRYQGLVFNRLTHWNDALGFLLQGRDHEVLS